MLVCRFLRDYPRGYSQPSKVLLWIRSHNPNPWIRCSLNSLGKIIRKLKSEKLNVDSKVTFCHLIFKSSQKSNDIPEPPRFNKNRPTVVSIHKQRRHQISRYLQYLPDAKARNVISQLASHNPHPWPDVIESHITRLLAKLKTRLSSMYKIENSKLSISRLEAIQNIQPIKLRQNTDKPPHIKEVKWRRIQI